MPRKVVKGTTENLNMLREKEDYNGIELGQDQELLKNFEPLEYRVPKVYDETTYKVYKYVKIKDIEIDVGTIEAFAISDFAKNLDINLE